MGTIAQELTRIQGAKSDLATSIANKGVTVPAATKIDGYAALVDQIQTGGGSNPFDDCDFIMLLSQVDGYERQHVGRFLNNLDDIYNSNQSGLPSVNFQKFAQGVKTSSVKVQKIFDIVVKFLSSYTVNSNLSYMFNYLSTTDSNNEVVFKPIWNNTNSIFNGTRIFSNLGYANTSEIKMRVMLNFEDFNIKGFNFSGNDFFSLPNNKTEIKIKDFPISNLYGNATFYFGNSSSNAIKELTVKGGLTNYTSTSVNTLDCHYMTGMTLDKWIAFFNSLGNTTMTNATVKIPSSIYSQLSQAEIQIVTDKGYLLASA